MHSINVPLGEQFIGNSRSQLWVLFGAVILVLFLSTSIQPPCWVMMPNK